MFVLGAFKAHLEIFCVLFVGQTIVNLGQVALCGYDEEWRFSQSLLIVTSIEVGRRWKSMQRCSADLLLLIDLWIDAQIRILCGRDKPAHLFEMCFSARHLT